MTSQLQIYPLPCFVIVELDPIGISSLTTGQMLGFANRGRWKVTVKLEQEVKDFLFFWSTVFHIGASRLIYRR